MSRTGCMGEKPFLWLNAEVSVKKFIPADLSGSFNYSRADASAWATETVEQIPRLPSGARQFWGVPFDLAPGDGAADALVVAGADGSTAPVTLPVKGKATHAVFAHFCDSRARKTTPVGDFDDPQTASYPVAVVTAPGEHLADYVLVYEDGSEERTVVRRRFEINQVATRMQSAFAARPHQGMRALDIRGPYPKNQWGRMQTGVFVGEIEPVERTQPVLPGVAPASWSIYALPNPHPDRPIAAVRIEPTGAAALAVGGLTLFNGKGHPLRHNRLETLRLEVEGKPLDPESARVEVDLGVVGRSYQAPAFDPEAWLAEPVRGWGEDPDGDAAAGSIFVEVTAGDDATLSVEGHDIDLASLYDGAGASSKDGRARARLMTRDRTWLHARVVDAATGRPTPVRVHFRAPDGRYFPPYGHRHEVNDNWFEDYGADLKLGSTPYAYVDGTFQIELPVGEVYAEVSKGFEYAPVRTRLDIKPGQRELEIKLDRIADLRSEGWVTADSHTHFITPDTAWLEGQAEGLNLIHLLASQWGDLYTNFGDITGGPAGASRDDTIVWVGTENRQHFLGHISMLGVKGEPVLPMCTSGPTEGYFGDPTWRAMSEWADECREKGGVVVVPHFPFPYSEVVAEVVRGRVDGLELRDFHTACMDTFAIHEWYRLLNCGYRVAAIGGTDKMSAGMPVGGVRTYAHIGDDDFSLESWGRAVRAGRTYTTSGPLLALSVEGRMPGGEIQVPPGGGKLHVEASALATMPFHTLQIVLNGKVVAEARAANGTTSAKLSEEIEVPGSCWIAARALSEHRAWHIWPVHFAAHTTPVFVQAKGDELFDGPTGQYLVTVMEGGLTWLDTLAIPAPPERHAAVRGVFEEAIAALQRRLGGDHAHGGASHHGHSDHSHGG